MLPILGLAATVVVSLSVTVSPEKANQPGAAKATIQLVADCDQDRSRAGTGFIRPGFELRIKPVEKKAAPEDKGPSGFCATLSGPLDGNSECRFQLLA